MDEKDIYYIGPGAASYSVSTSGSSLGLTDPTPYSIPEHTHPEHGPQQGGQSIARKHVCDGNTEASMAFVVYRSDEDYPGGWYMLLAGNEYVSGPIHFCPYCGERLEGGNGRPD